MDNQNSSTPFAEAFDHVLEHLHNQRFADVFRFISFKPGETYGPHSHVRIEINYVKHGTCMLHLDGETISFHEDEIMIICSNVSHIFEAGSIGATLMQLEFQPDIFTTLGGEILTTDSSFLWGDNVRVIKMDGNVRIVRVMQCILNELDEKKPFHRQLVVMHYMELLILIERYLDEHILPVCNNESLKHAVSYMRLHYRESMSMNDVAVATGVSARYLRKLFGKYLGMSPLEYLNGMRIDGAIELLRNTDLSVKEVCYKCGFKSPQYFSRIFKQRIGCTPMKFLK